MHLALASNHSSLSTWSSGFVIIILTSPQNSLRLSRHVLNIYPVNVIATHCPSNTDLLLCRTWVNNLGCDIKSSWFYIYNRIRIRNTWYTLIFSGVDLSPCQKYCMDTFTWKTEVCLCWVVSVNYNP